MNRVTHPALSLAAAISMVGCASLPPDRGYSQAEALVQGSIGTTPDWSRVVPAEAPNQALSAEQSVRFAFAHNARIHQLYAKLGIGRSELEQARRISNPGIGYSYLDVPSGSSQITRSAALMISDLLLLPSRKRLAEGELERLQMEVADELLSLAIEVEIAWYHHVGAKQVLAMRELTASAAESSAQLAARFHAAGNISQLQLAQENAAAAQAKIAAVRAAAEALQARKELASLLGLTIDTEWDTLEQLPSPPSAIPKTDAMVAMALEQRLDLAAAQRAVALREDVLGVTQRWRWLGSVELGYERETEPDGSILRGPGIEFELPLFDQGQGEVGHATAELIDARAQLDALALEVANQARIGVAGLKVNRDIAERYRQILVPERERIVARTQEQFNFMLIGVFELILAKREEYDAYQEYLEAVRDYWIARSQLRRIVGGRLPDDLTLVPTPTVSVDWISPKPSQSHDPHAGHQMPTTNSADDQNTEDPAHTGDSQ